MSFFRRFFAFLFNRWRGRAKVGKIDRADPAFLAEKIAELTRENESLFHELELAKEELKYCYREIGHSRNAEKKLAEELNLRREALYDLSDTNALLRDQCEKSRKSETNACKRVLSLEHSMRTMELKHQEEVMELNKALHASQSHAARAEETSNRLEERVAHLEAEGRIGEVDGPRRASEIELRQQVEAATATAEEMKEIAFTAVAYKRAAAQYLRAQPMIGALLQKTASLASQSNVDGRQLDPIVQGLRQMLSPQQAGIAS